MTFKRLLLVLCFLSLEAFASDPDWYRIIANTEADREFLRAVDSRNFTEISRLIESKKRAATEQDMQKCMLEVEVRYFRLHQQPPQLYIS